MQGKHRSAEASPQPQDYARADRFRPRPGYRSEFDAGASGATRHAGPDPSAEILGGVLLVMAVLVIAVGLVG